MTTRVTVSKPFTVEVFGRTERMRPFVAVHRLDADRIAYVLQNGGIRLFTRAEGRVYLSAAAEALLASELPRRYR